MMYIEDTIQHYAIKNKGFNLRKNTKSSIFAIQFPTLDEANKFDKEISNYFEEEVANFELTARKDFENNIVYLYLH